MASKYTLGIDYGTDSVRCLIVNTSDGNTEAISEHYYSRWKEGKYCKPEISQFRQHPLDYLEGIETTIIEALKNVTQEIRNNIVGISVDTTGSTPVLVDKSGTPLALLPAFEENPNGMFILWKDHRANKEAQEINELSKNWHTDYTKYVGGIYSSEWFWAKYLHVIREDEAIRKEAYSCVELCDWISAHLTGNVDPKTLKRSRCAAGHKALWHKEFGGLPPQDFWTALDPLFANVTEGLFSESYVSTESMGTLSKEWAAKLNLNENIIIGVGGFDAHMGAVGGCVESYTLCKIIGTSTCDILIAPSQEIGNKLIKGICGQVDGSVTPNMMGMEAGQSAFGDLYAWFRNVLLFPFEEIKECTDQYQTIKSQLIVKLSEKASLLPTDENSVVTLDWMNGRRTPDANHALKGAIANLNLGSSAPIIFKSIVDATAFGSKQIIKRFESEGIPIKKVIAMGGVAKKSVFVMQTLANVLNLPIKVVRSENACALGAAMFAAVAAGVYNSIEEAQQKMSSGFDAEYHPQPKEVIAYEHLFEKYVKLGNLIEKQF